MEIVFVANPYTGYSIDSIDSLLPVIEGCCNTANFTISGFPNTPCDCGGENAYTMTMAGTGYDLFDVVCSDDKISAVTFTGKIKICSNVSSDAVVSILCAGNVIATINVFDLINIIPSPITVDATSLAFGTVISGQILTATIVLMNNSLADIEIDPSITGSCANLTMVNGSNFTLSPGVPTEFFVQFAPSVSGINLACIIAFNKAGADPVCPLAQVTISGKSLDDCTLPSATAINPSDCHVDSTASHPTNTTNPFKELHRAFANFYNCTDIDLVTMGTRLKDTGFFGLFDKSKKAANDINDVHYLALMLYTMWVEKVEDAMSNCECCRCSKHPKYYIDKYNLQCVYEYFKCKNIDISCWLKAFKVDQLFILNNYFYTPDNIYSWNLVFGSPEQFVSCPYDCCLESETYASDWIYEHLLSYEECEEEANCEWNFTMNVYESSDMFVWNIGEDYNCNATFTYNLNEDPCNI